MEAEGQEQNVSIPSVPSSYRLHGSFPTRNGFSSHGAAIAFPRIVTAFRSDDAGNCRNDKARSVIQLFDGLMMMGVVG